MSNSNAIQVIRPYWHEEIQTWVFDDDRVGLVKEPFVAGIPEMINDLVKDIPNAQTGFRMFFSPTPFPGFQRKIQWLRPEMGGNWYRMEELNLEGWLCPALFHYYDEAPQELYVKAEAV